MKKFLSVILLLSLSFAFFSCGGDDEKDDPEKPEPFVWGGDWNDPNDAAYKPEYGGKYNPIKGLWKNTKYQQEGFYFSEDFKAYTVYFYENGGNTKEPIHTNSYQINDKAYRFSRATPNTYLYRIENGLLYIYNEASVGSIGYFKVTE